MNEIEKTRKRMNGRERKSRERAHWENIEGVGGERSVKEIYRLMERRRGQ